jgi:hypothetical protein
LVAPDGSPVGPPKLYRAGWRRLYDRGELPDEAR